MGAHLKYAKHALICVLAQGLTVSSNQTYVADGNTIDLYCAASGSPASLVWSYQTLTIIHCLVVSELPDGSGTSISLLDCPIDSETEFNIRVMMETMAEDEEDWRCDELASGDYASTTVVKHSKSVCATLVAWSELLILQ